MWRCRFPCLHDLVVILLWAPLIQRAVNPQSLVIWQALFEVVASEPQQTKARSCPLNLAPSDASLPVSTCVNQKQGIHIGECQEVGAMLCAHLAIDGFQVWFCCDVCRNILLRQSQLPSALWCVVEPKDRRLNPSIMTQSTVFGVAFGLESQGFNSFFACLVFFIDCPLVVASHGPKG